MIEIFRDTVGSNIGRDLVLGERAEFFGKTLMLLEEAAGKIDIDAGSLFEACSRRSIPSRKNDSINIWINPLTHVPYIWERDVEDIGGNFSAMDYLRELQEARTERKKTKSYLKT
jgi:hypothetical protein